METNKQYFIEKPSQGAEDTFKWENMKNEENIRYFHSAWMRYFEGAPQILLKLKAEVGSPRA